MGSFGDRLRREREQRGISLDDIALTTKIRAGLLQALEEEKFDRLPGGIFNKGFVRAYARHLGLDEDQAVADYLAASGEAPSRRPESAAGARGDTTEPRIQLVREEPESESGQGSPHGVRGLFAGLLVLVVVGASAWFYYHRERRTESPASQEPAAVMTPANPAVSSNTSPAQPSSTPASGTPESKPEPSQAAGAQKPSAPTTPAESKPATVGNPSVVPAGAFAVRLKADEECWLQIAADGKSEEVTMEAGLDKTITAKNRLTVRAGNVGALEVSFNGTKLPTQGDYGQVKTLVFGPNGLEPTGLRPGDAAPTANP